MKTWSKFAIVLSGVLFASGIAATAAGLSMGGTLNYSIVLGRGYQASAIAQDWTTIDLEDYDAFQSYALEVQDAEVQVLCDPACESPYLKARLSKSTQIHVASENNLLNVTTDSSAKGASYMGFRFDFPVLNLALDDSEEETVHEQLILCLPEKDQRSGIIKSSYGDITVSGGSGDLTIDADCGDVNISGRNGGNLTAQLDYGDLEVETSVLTEIHLTLSDGDVSCDGITMDTLTARLSYGTADLRDCILRNGHMDTSDGDLRVEGIQLEEALELESDYGNIILNLPDGPKGYSLDLNTQYGFVQVGGKTYETGVLMERQGLPQVTAQTSDGNIEVS